MSHRSSPLSPQCHVLSLLICFLQSPSLDTQIRLLVRSVVGGLVDGRALWYVALTHTSCCQVFSFGKSRHVAKEFLRLDIRAQSQFSV